MGRSVHSGPWDKLELVGWGQPVGSNKGQGDSRAGGVSPKVSLLIILTSQLTSGKGRSRPWDVTEIEHGGRFGRMDSPFLCLCQRLARPTLWQLPPLFSQGLVEPSVRTLPTRKQLPVSSWGLKAVCNPASGVHEAEEDG